MKLSVEALVEHVSSKIEEATVENAPFAHFVVDELLPIDVYSELVASLPATSAMQRVTYPGTGYGKRGPRYSDFGYAYRDLAIAEGPLGAVRQVFASEAFSRALLDKFSRAIPAEKHIHFADSASDYTSVFDLQVDLPGYAIAPHPDVPSKIVTYQLYLPADESLASQGTSLCVPKDGRGARGRTWPARFLGRVIDQSLKNTSASYKRIERSPVGELIGVGAQSSWLPWSWFDVAKVVPALPNHFLAFAPNERSFHAVAMDNLEGERPVIRGFLRSGSDQKNWISPATG
jgi:hypothetical protein